ANPRVRGFWVGWLVIAERRGRTSHQCPIAAGRGDSGASPLGRTPRAAPRPPRRARGPPGAGGFRRRVRVVAGGRGGPPASTPLAGEARGRPVRPGRGRADRLRPCRCLVC